MDKLISEQAVLRILNDYHRAWFLNDKRFMEMVNAIKAIPSTEPKIGHWNKYSSNWMCDQCNRLVSERSDCCPHCGVKMGGEQHG